MKQLNGRHFAASLRDLEAVTQHGFAVNSKDTGQALKQDFNPAAAEGIQQAKSSILIIDLNLNAEPTPET
jgi:hypothetical protein